MHKRKQGLLLFIVLMLLIPGTVFALDSTPWSAGSSSGEDLRIKLITIEPGDALYSWWGHTAVVVEDTRTGFSRFYNYGLFSFEQENFFLNFAMGRLYFLVGAFPTNRELSGYRRLNRTIYIQILALSPARRLEMARFLDNNVLPENRVYLYHHYDDNCATRVRDLIDRMTDGRLAVVSAAPAELTLRQHTRRHTYRGFFIDWLLMFLMGNSIDRQITGWEEMFLPVELAAHLRQVRLPDSNGQLQPLVSEESVFYRARQRPEVPDKAAPHWPYTLMIGLGLAGLALFLALKVRRAAKTLPRVLFGLYQAFLGLLYGIPGTILLLMALITDHDVTYRNENLFLANPLTLLMLPLGICLALNRKIRWLPLLCYTQAALGLLSLLLKLLPGFDQQNWISLAAMLPVSLALALSWVLLRRSRTKRSRTKRSRTKRS